MDAAYGDLMCAGDFLVRLRNVQNVFTFKVAALGHVIIVAENRSFDFAEMAGDFFPRPDEKLSFFALRVRVLARVEPPAGVSHFTRYVVEGLFSNAAGEIVSGQLIEVQI